MSAGDLIKSAGKVVWDYAAAEHYPDSVTSTLRGVYLGRWPHDFEQTITAFSVPNAVVTSCYVPVDVDNDRMFLNQTYSNAPRFFQLRFVWKADSYVLRSRPTWLPGRHVLIGGAFDGVWWHWMVNWAPRLLLLKRLRPELFSDPHTRFLVDRVAEREPFTSVLTALGVPLSRVTFADQTQDYQLEDAVLVSFPDQASLFPGLVRYFAAALRRRFRSRLPIRQRKRIFCSRQAFTTPKRRIANFDAIKPVLDAFDFKVVQLAELSLCDQIQLFESAEMVVGAHGSDFTDLMFCRPGTKVIVFEPERNLESGVSTSLEQLCRIIGLDYHAMVVPEVQADGVDYGQFVNVHNQDLHVDPAALELKVRELLADDRPSPRPTRPGSAVTSQPAR